MAAAPPAVAKNPLNAKQTADKFLQIAYTWKTAWYSSTGPTGPSIGKRDKSYTAQALDAVLTKVVIGPETDANLDSFTPGTGIVLSSKPLPGGVKAMLIKLPIVDKNASGSTTFYVQPSVRVKLGKNGWKAVGAALPEAAGPTKYCVDSPAADQHCDIYPPGSD